MQQRRVVHHHVELARHDVVLAEGLPAETYPDAGERASFNGGAAIRLFTDFAATLQPEIVQVW